MQEKKKKLYKKIGLLAVVLVIIGLVVGIVFTVEHYMPNAKPLKNSHIGKDNSYIDFNFQVYDIEFVESIGENICEKDNIFAVVYINIATINDSAISYEDFKINGVSIKNNYGSDYLYNTMSLEKNKNYNVKVAIEIKSNMDTQLFLQCFGFSVDLGAQSQSSL